MRERGTCAEDLFLHLGLYGRRLEKLSAVGPDNTFALRPVFELLEIRNDEHRWKSSLVADHHRLTGELVRLYQPLDRLGRDVLSACSDDDVLLAIGDCDEPIAYLTDVSRVEPAVCVDRFSGSRGIVVVAPHYPGAAREDLTILRNRHFDARNRTPDCPD